MDKLYVYQKSDSVLAVGILGEEFEQISQGGVIAEIRKEGIESRITFRSIDLQRLDDDCTEKIVKLLVQSVDPLSGYMKSLMSEILKSAGYEKIDVNPRINSYWNKIEHLDAFYTEPLRKNSALFLHVTTYRGLDGILEKERILIGGKADAKSGKVAALYFPDERSAITYLERRGSRKNIRLDCGIRGADVGLAFRIDTSQILPCGFSKTNRGTPFALFDVDVNLASLQNYNDVNLNSKPNALL